MYGATLDEAINNQCKLIRNLSDAYLKALFDSNKGYVHNYCWLINDTFCANN